MAKATTGSQSKLIQSPLEIAASYMERAPVDLNGLAEKLGIGVFINPDMNVTLSGLITRCSEDSSGFRIEINGKHSLFRQRFTLAHEISHYLLHENIIGDGVTDNAMYRSGLSDYFEVQANNLAANILMPNQLVRRLFDAGLRSNYGLQQAFQVSQEAMQIRLNQLGLAL